MPQPIPYRPHYCVWELTLSCNLRCAHCGSVAGRPRAEELTTAQCVDVVEQLADLDCRLITLSGGEPTLRDDWEAIAAAAVRRGVTVNMVSNGTTMTEEMARRVAGSGLANVGVSLDGPERVHDGIRGKGAFQRAARGLQLLHEAKVPTAVLTHLDRSTSGLLEETHQIAVDLGAGAWRVQLGKPMGRLCENRARLLEPEDLLTVLPRIARIKQGSSIWVDVGDSVGYYGPFERTLRRTAWGRMRDTWSGCQAGRFAIGIESDGGVKGCLSLQAKLGAEGGPDPFREGDLREKRLAEIWFAEHAFAFNREQKVEDLTGSCRKCSHAKVCRGGAKCVAAAFTGGVSEDPYCYHRVALAASPARRVVREARRGAAAAALGIGVTVGLGGCFTPVGPGEEDPPMEEPRDASTTVVKPPAAGPDAGTPVKPPEPGKDAGYDPCFNSCPTCDYGVMPPECFAGPDASVVDPCAPPCADCDYGILPPECYAKDAGTPGPDAGEPDPCICLDYGVLPDPSDPTSCCGVQPPDAGDPCANVCCECDYGVVPPGCCK